MRTLLDTVTAKKPVQKTASTPKTTDAYTRQRVAAMREKSRFRSRMYDRMIAAGHAPV